MLTRIDVINMMIDYDRDKGILIAIGIIVVILVSLFIATRSF